MALNTPMKIVLTVVIIFLIGIGFYLLDYQKKLSDIKQLDQNIQSKTDQLRKNEERVKQLPILLTKQDNLKTELDNLIQEKLPSEEVVIFVPRFIQEMEKLIASERKSIGDKSMQVISITPGRLETPGSQQGGEGQKQQLMMFPKQPFQVHIKAKYASVIHILHQLAALKLKRLVTINRISLSPAEGAKYGQSPALNVQMPMVAYLKEDSKKKDETTETTP